MASPGLALKSGPLQAEAGTRQIICISVLLTSPLMPLASRSAVEPWTRWEQSLTSTETHTAPSSEVQIKVSVADYRAPFWQIDGAEMNRVLPDTT
jgi:hypothetical protein